MKGARVAPEEVVDGPPPPLPEGDIPTLAESLTGADEEKLFDDVNKLSYDYIRISRKAPTSCCQRVRHNFYWRHVLWIIFFFFFVGGLAVVYLLGASQEPRSMSSLSAIELSEETGGLVLESFAAKMWRAATFQPDSPGASRGASRMSMKLNTPFNGTFVDVMIRIAADDYIFLSDRYVGALLLWVLSLFGDFFVIFYHIVNPPHPKFSLTVTRHRCVSMHAFAGAAECIAGLVIIFLDGLQRVYMIWYMAAYSLVHVVTAAFLFPTVFGTRKIMLPAYITATCLKILCWYKLVNAMLNPAMDDEDQVGIMSCSVSPSVNLRGVKKEVLMLSWFLALVVVHHIYVWCRIFIMIFNKMNVFRKEQYTISILLAGMVCCPTALGIFGTAIIWIGIIAWQIFVESCECYNRSCCCCKSERYDETANHLLRGHAELSRNPIFSDLYAEHAVEVLNKCGIQTVSDLKEKAEDALVSLVYLVVDLNNSKVMSLFELHELCVNWGIPSREVTNFFESSGLDKGGASSTISRSEFEEKLEPIWRYGIVALTEAVSRMERYAIQWAALNPGKDPPTPNHMHLFGHPTVDFAQAIADVRQSSLKEHPEKAWA
eukprot:g5136.t1